MSMIHLFGPKDEERVKDVLDSELVIRSTKNDLPNQTKLTLLSITKRLSY